MRDVISATLKTLNANDDLVNDDALALRRTRLRFEYLRNPKIYVLQNLSFKNFGPFFIGNANILRRSSIYGLYIIFWQFPHICIFCYFPSCW